MQNHRIDIIDGFRGLAILAVVLFHYYTRFESERPLLVHWVSYGYYGVHLFFAISGFVICQSLEKTESFVLFLRHRLIRLMPCMILCSVITYGIVSLIHPETDLEFFRPDTLLNFLPSWTFTSPEIWNFLFDRKDIDFLDGSYWSLWVEVIFYAVAGSLYFLDKQRFLTRWLFLAFVVTLIRVIVLPQLHFINSQFYETKLYQAFTILNLNYWVFFSVGIFSFFIYVKRKVSFFQLVVMASMGLLEFCVLSEGLVAKVLFLLMITLFLFFVKRPGIISFLETRVFVTLGLISYPLYLIHQNVGLILVFEISKFFSSDYIFLFIPLIVLSLMVAFSYIVHFYYERPVIRYLRSL